MLNMLYLGVPYHSESTKETCNMERTHVHPISSIRTLTTQGKKEVCVLGLIEN
jgi:hypothetical protein